MPARGFSEGVLCLFCCKCFPFGSFESNQTNAWCEENFQTGKHRRKRPFSTYQLSFDRMVSSFYSPVSSSHYYLPRQSQCFRPFLIVTTNIRRHNSCDAFLVLLSIWLFPRPRILTLLHDAHSIFQKSNPAVTYRPFFFDGPSQNYHSFPSLRAR